MEIKIDPFKYEDPKIVAIIPPYFTIYSNLSM